MKTWRQAWTHGQHRNNCFSEGACGVLVRIQCVADGGQASE